MRGSLLGNLSAVAACLLALAPTAAVFGQASTYSGLSGTISNESGTTVSGATVTVVHVPTGSRYQAQPGSGGRYNLQGLRVGGPYTITVSAPTYRTVERTGVFLELSKSSELNFQLPADTGEVVNLEAYVIEAEPLSVFDGERTGTGTIISSARVEDTATVTRSITDFARLDPLITMNETDRQEITAAGQHFRSNSIQIDGININDQFGLEANGVSAIKNPISIDTIEEFSVEIAPYDARQSGFTGASINAVTKSGTNRLSGSAYYYFTDDNFRGENPATGAKEPFEETTYGATLGGPIIKDRLWFFLNYEKFERTAEANDPGFIPDQDQVDRIRTRAQALGFDAGTFTTIQAAQEEEKMLVKLDWNINDNHRLSLRYDTNDGQQPQFGEYSDFSSSSPETALSTHFFTDDRQIETGVAQLFSIWSNSLHSQLRFGRTNVDKIPQLQQPFFPEIEVRGIAGTTQSGGRTTRGEVFFGTEDSRQSNELTSEITNMALNFDYYVGDTTISFGADSEKSEFYNLFLQDTMGNFVYTSLANFENDILAFGNRAFGIAGQSVAAESDYTVTGVYAQAKWRTSPSLTLTAGLRTDFVSTDRSPAFAQHFFDAFGLRNDYTVGGEHTIAPRLSFNYSPVDQPGIQVRGGIGVFQGRAPAVFLSNSFSNNGVSTVNISASSATFKLADYVNGTSADPRFNFDAANPRADVAATTLGNRIDLVEEGLKLPSILRGNLAVDLRTPYWNTILSAEVIQTWTQKTTYVADLNLNRIGTTPDGRSRFGGDPFSGNGANPAFSNVYQLRNSSEGEATNVVFSATLPNLNGWYGSLSYTFGDSTDVSSMTSSTAFSNNTNRAIFEQNTDETGTSNYEIQHRLLFNAGYSFKWNGNWRTRVSLLYEGRSGRPYSVIFGTDVNGDGTSFNDLLYIPDGLGDSRVTFASPADQSGFFDFVEANNLSKYAGTHAPRNSQRSSWVNRVDIKFAQEIPFGDRYMLELFLDVLNVGNLINDEWGLTEEIPFSYTQEVVDATIVNNQYVYTFLDPDGPSVQTNRSRWALQFGTRFKF